MPRVAARVLSDDARDFEGASPLGIRRDTKSVYRLGLPASADFEIVKSRIARIVYEDRRTRAGDTIAAMLTGFYRAYAL